MDEERLIILVSEYRELYDLSHKNYSNQEVKNNCWKEIGEAMGQPVSTRKEKWSRIRDNFRKALKFRKCKSGDAAEKIKPYKYEQELSFLKPFLCDRIQKSNFSPQSQEEDTNEQIEENDNFGESEPPTPTSISSIENTPSTTASKGKKRSQQQMAPQNSVATVLEKYLASQASRPSVNTEAKGLRQFFIAMADTVETFPQAQQIEVKAKVFNIIQTAEMNCLRQKQSAPPQYSHDTSSSRFQIQNSSYYTNYPQGPQGTLTALNQPSIPPYSPNYSNDGTDLNFGA